MLEQCTIISELLQIITIIRKSYERQTSQKGQVQLIHFNVHFKRTRHFAFGRLFQIWNNIREWFPLAELWVIWVINSRHVSQLRQALVMGYTASGDQRGRQQHKKKITLNSLSLPVSTNLTDASRISDTLQYAMGQW